VQRTGTVGKEEFLTILTAKYATRDPEEELRKAFELFDVVSVAGRVGGERARPPRPLDVSAGGCWC